ncbi:MAG: S9 family peptidase [Gemmatimonadota bacterium]|nr:S9 family peptidase [Gemmatimonadota bacterium]
MPSTVRWLAILCLALLGVGEAAAQEQNRQENPEPPMARTVPESLETHGHVRVDPYYWLRERENPDVVAYLEAENEYTESMTSHLEGLRETLFEEIKGRIKQDDSSVPYRKDDYFYYRRYEEGDQYPIYARKKGSLEAEEEVLLDANALAEGHDFLSVRASAVSPDHRTLAFAVDTVGRRFYTVRFKDLETGEAADDVIPKVTGNLAWASDSRTIFYSKQDPKTLRSHRIFRHRLGDDPADDALVYEEADETFSTYVFRSRSERYLMIGSFQTLSDEWRYLDADDPTGEFRLFLPRERGHEHTVHHLGDHFYIRTNEGDAENFKLMRTPVDDTARGRWEEVIPHRQDVLLEGFTPFDDHLVVTERKAGLIQLRIRPWDDPADEHYLDFGEEAYLAYVQNNPETDSGILRYAYQSMTTPESVYDYDMETRERTLLKRDEVLGDFDPADYATERISAPARDGERVPVSLVYRKDRFDRSGDSPLLLYGYGSYGYSLDPTFSASRLSLLDRGFVYAIAHVRGGEVLGRRWYEAGKLLNKRNTFTDFIDVAEHLVSSGYADADRVYAIGGSAGGLLMGAVVNMRPDLFDGIVARVPWVDVVTTMLDDDIPLTTSEFDEWGDPKEKEYYDYMLTYSPYDNVVEQPYPNMLVTTGLHDSQVQYWEPAKWVARLRARKTDDNTLLLKTNMEAGHGGASGRYERYRETAFIYAFLLDLAGLAGSER